MKTYWNYWIVGIGILSGILFVNCSGGPARGIEKMQTQNADYSISQKIAFTSSRDGNWEVYIISSDTKEVSRLTESVREEEGLAPSADGTRLALLSRPGGGFGIYGQGPNGG